MTTRKKNGSTETESAELAIAGLDYQSALGHLAKAGVSSTTIKGGEGFGFLVREDGAWCMGRVVDKQEWSSEPMDVSKPGRFHRRGTDGMWRTDVFVVELAAPSSYIKRKVDGKEVAVPPAETFTAGAGDVPPKGTLIVFYASAATEDLEQYLDGQTMLGLCWEPTIKLKSGMPFRPLRIDVLRDQKAEAAPKLSPEQTQGEELAQVLA